MQSQRLITYIIIIKRIDHSELSFVVDVCDLCEVISKHFVGWPISLWGYSKIYLCHITTCCPISFWYHCPRFFYLFLNFGRSWVWRRKKSLLELLFIAKILFIMLYCSKTKKAGKENFQIWVWFPNTIFTTATKHPNQQNNQIGNPQPYCSSSSSSKHPNQPSSTI